MTGGMECGQERTLLDAFSNWMPSQAAVSFFLSFVLSFFPVFDRMIPRDILLVLAYGITASCLLLLRMFGFDPRRDLHNVSSSSSEDREMVPLRIALQR